MNDQNFSTTDMEDEQNLGSFEGDQSTEDQPGEHEEPSQPRAVIVVKKDGETVLELTVDTLPVQIGRKGDNHIVLEEKNVSRKHAQILMKEGQYVIEDLESTGGTFERRTRHPKGHPHG